MSHRFFISTLSLIISIPFSIYARGSEAYLSLYSAWKHLSMHREALHALEEGYYHHSTCEKIRKLLGQNSEEWLKTFENQEISAVVLQSLLRGGLAKARVKGLRVERDFQRRVEKVHRMNVKWEIKRMLGRYSDRRGKVRLKDLI